MSVQTNKRRANGHRRNQLIQRHRAAGEDCHICGQPIDYTLTQPDPWACVIDEIIPVALGGDPLSWHNTHAAHRWCNQLKGTRTLEWAQAAAKKILSGEKNSANSASTIAPHRRLGV